MSGLVLPTSKSKRDGEMLDWSDGDCTALCIRGDYQPMEIVRAALKAVMIDDEQAQLYVERGRFYQSWFKKVPRPGYAYWCYPYNAPIRGSFFGSVLTLD